MELILASQSPRRRELLARLGLTFTIRPADIDETMDPARSPFDEVARLSARKAAAIAETAGDGAVVVAADTVVVLEDRVLGKPRSADEAREMLRSLSGRPHQVMTGMTVLRSGRAQTDTVVTDVHFRPLEEAEIEAYVASGEPMDKAGAYGIQGLGGALVRRIEGDYYATVGLSLFGLRALLREAGLR